MCFLFSILNTIISIFKMVRTTVFWYILPIWLKCDYEIYFNWMCQFKSRTKETESGKIVEIVKNNLIGSSSCINYNVITQNMASGPKVQSHKFSFWNTTVKQFRLHIVDVKIRIEKVIRCSRNFIKKSTKA
jgi:hypothetical protein